MLKQAKAKARAESKAKGRSRTASPKGAAPSHDTVSDLSKTVLDSSRHIWLAGLGAFSKAQAGGRKVFDTLVQQGEALEKHTRNVAAETAAAARGAATAKAKEVQKMAGGTWDKLEQVFEDRVERALSKLGVYTQNDVQRLAARVDELSDAVNELLKAAGAKPVAKPAKKRAAAKPAAAPKAARKARPKAVKAAEK
jgi:poly(hydroxyalkanoate) granule-associated protein